MESWLGHRILAFILLRLSQFEKIFNVNLGNLSLQHTHAHTSEQSLSPKRWWRERETCWIQRVPWLSQNVELSAVPILAGVFASRMPARQRTPFNPHGYGHTCTSPEWHPRGFGHGEPLGNRKRCVCGPSATDWPGVGRGRVIASADRLRRGWVHLLDILALRFGGWLCRAQCVYGFLHSGLLCTATGYMISINEDLKNGEVMRKYFDFADQMNYPSLQIRNNIYNGSHKKTWIDITRIVDHNHVFQKVISNGIHCYTIRRPLSPPLESPRSHGWFATNTLVCTSVIKETLTVTVTQ